MRRLLFTFAVLFVLLLLGSDSPKEYDDRTEMADIEGTWRMVSSGIGRQQNPVAGLAVVTYQRGKWSCDLNGVFLNGGYYKTDNSRTPATLDEVHTAGQGLSGERNYIYRVEGDTLRTACNPNNILNRPRSFDEEGVYIGIWKRVK